MKSSSFVCYLFRTAWPTYVVRLHKQKVALETFASTARECIDFHRRRYRAKAASQTNAIARIIEKYLVAFFYDLLFSTLFVQYPYWKGKK